jgi:hypothetical protein
MAYDPETMALRATVIGGPLSADHHRPKVAGLITTRERLWL